MSMITRYNIVNLIGKGKLDHIKYSHFYNLTFLRNTIQIESVHESEL